MLDVFSRKILHPILISESINSILPKTQSRKDINQVGGSKRIVLNTSELMLMYFAEVQIPVALCTEYLRYAFKQQKIDSSKSKREFSTPK